MWRASRARDPRVLTHALPTGARANGKMISRMVKMTALLAAPYDHALFLDSDTFVCKPWTELLEHVRLGGFMRAFDFALAQNHIDSTSLPPKALWDHYGVPQAFAVGLGLGLGLGEG